MPEYYSEFFFVMQGPAGALFYTAQGGRKLFSKHANTIVRVSYLATVDVYVDGV